MSVSRILRSYLGREDPPAEHAVGLFAGAAEVNADGYHRQTVRRGAWAMGRDGVARATVRFGPFAEAAAFDRTRLMAGGEMVSETVQGLVTLRAGMAYEAHLEVEVRGGG